MNLADEIKKEVETISAEKYEVLRESIKSGIKGNGYRNFLCGNHISGINNHALNSKYRREFLQWVTKNGLKYSVGCNSYGVEVLKITL